jgi:hypothetical protein
VNTGAPLPDFGSGYFTENASCTSGRPPDVLMESRMRGDSQVRLYVQRLIMLSARSVGCVLPAEHDFGW